MRPDHSRARTLLAMALPLTLLGLTPAPPPARLAAAPAPPTLSAPAAGAVLAPGFTLAWTNPPGTTQVQVQLLPFNNDGPGIDLQFGAPATQLAVPAPPAWFGILPDLGYTWRVRASNATSFVGAEDSSWSPWAQRGFRSAKVDGRSIGFVAPAEATVVDSLTPTLVWSDTLPTLFYYELRLSKDRNFDTNPATASAMVYTALLHGALSQPPRSYTVPAGAPLEENTTYYWQVRPRVQGDGVALAWGAVASFRTAGPPPEQPQWLALVNRFRAIAALPPVVEHPDWSDGCRKHAAYMALNDVIGHSESPSLPGFTQEGHNCAQKGNVYVSSRATTPDSASIDAWITGPFHAIGIIDPQLRQAGFGSASDDAGRYRHGAALNVIQGIDRNVQPQFPVLFPGNGSTMPLLAYAGNESPDPLTACPGYTAPTGPPIMVQLGSFSVVPNVTATTLTRDGEALEHCVYDEANYTNPDPGSQQLARAILDGRGAVVVMPRAPLVSGGSYTVSIVNSGVTHTWSFAVE